MTDLTDTETWIITGATRGFGRALTEQALDTGATVVAAVRRPDTLDDLRAAHGGRLVVVRFDASDTSRAPSVVDAALAATGRIDVLVNNAGRGIVGAVEELTEGDLRAGMDLHLHVPVALVRAALPTMRAQGRGTIVQLSSQGGRVSFPGVGAYSAGKFALEGLSEALAGEVAPFGIRVMIVEPSRFRTSFNDADALSIAPADDAYRSVLDAVRADLTGAVGVQEGDPVRAARIIVELARGDDVPLRLPLGSEAVQRIGRGYRDNLAALERLAHVARSADFPDAAPSARAV